MMVLLGVGPGEQSLNPPSAFRSRPRRDRVVGEGGEAAGLFALVHSDGRRGRDRI